MTRGFIPLLALVLAAGLSALAFATDDFRVVTSEGARELAIERQPRPVPNVKLFDQTGARFSLADYRGKTLLVDFIYTRCPTICTVLGDEFQQALTRSRGRLARSTDLLSISFDPQNDDREALQAYGERYDAKAPRWRIAAPVDRNSLDLLLRTFGVIVVPDGLGGFVHNTAVYEVDARGRLVRILDLDAPQQVADATIEKVRP